MNDDVKTEVKPNISDQPVSVPAINKEGAPQEVGDLITSSEAKLETPSSPDVKTEVNPFPHEQIQDTTVINSSNIQNIQDKAEVPVPAVLPGATMSQAEAKEQLKDPDKTKNKVWRALIEFREYVKSMMKQNPPLQNPT